MDDNDKSRIKPRLNASFTLEAAGIMATIFLSIAFVLGFAFQQEIQVRTTMKLHREMEIERHALENVDEKEIEKQWKGNGWEREMRARVFRPEKDLRIFSLLEEFR